MNNMMVTLEEMTSISLAWKPLNEKNPALQAGNSARTIFNAQTITHTQHERKAKI
jgi:hypothetical protein